MTAAGQTIPGYSGTWRFIEPAEGQSIWDGGSTVDNKWSSPANWVGDVQPSSGPGVNVTFEGTPPRLAPDLDSARTVGQLRFNTDAAAFTLVSASGYTLTLDGTTPGISQQSANNEGIGHGLLLMTNTIFDTLGAGVLTVSGPISGAGGIAKYSSGELSLTASNSYGGTNILYNGLVNVQNASALGSTNTGTWVLGTATLEIAGNINIGAEPLSLNSPGFNNEGAICNEWGNNSYAGVITLEGASRINTDGGILTVIGNISNSLAGAWDLTVGGAGNVILSNVVATGTGGLTKDGAGTLTLKGGSANLFSGNTTVSGGLLELGKSAGITAVAGNLQIGDGTGTDTVRLLARDQINDAVSVTLASSGVLDLNGFNENIANLNAASLLSKVTLGSGTLTVSGFDNSSFNGVISGAGALVKTNAGTLIFFGPNTYAGATTISGGVLRIENSTAMGNVTAAATVSSGAALELKDGIAVGAKPLSLSGSGIGGTGGGALRNIAGDNSWAGSITLAAPARINSDAGALSLSGPITGAQALSLGGAAGNSLISGVLGLGSAGLTLDGGGAVTLTGANTYSGATAVSAGTLVVANTSGSATGSGAVTLGSSTSGAILATGTGAPASGNKISGLLTTTGTTPHILPGNAGGIGTLNLGGGLTLGGTTPGLDYDLNSSDSTIGSGVNDLVNITGNLVVNSATVINVLFSGTPSSAKTYRLLSYSGPKSGSGTFSIGTISPPLKNYTLDQSIAGQVNLSVNGLPAASAYRITPAGSPVAGTAYAITVTAVDASGNVLAGFNGDMDLTFSGLGSVPGHAPTVTDKTGSAKSLGTATTLTFTSGIATASLVAYKAEGPVTLAATDGTFSTSSAGGTGATLTVGSSATASALAVSGFPSPTPAGVPGNVTVTALDPYGNTATGYRGTIEFTSSDSVAVLPANYTFVAGDNGAHIFIVAVTLKTPGTQSITATDTGTITGTQSGITVANIAPVAGIYARLKSVGATATDAQTPDGSLIVGLDGKLYGTTLAGGANGAGTIFRVETNGASFTVLYSFKNDGSDGRAPYCALVQGAGGLLYGTTYSGGSKDAGTVFRLNADGTGYAKLHDFGIGADGANAYAELYVGRDGKLYGTTLYGGANNAGTLFKIGTDGIGYTKLYDFGGTGDGEWPYAGLIQGPVGDDAFYGVTDSGGANGVGTVFKISGDGTGYTRLRSFSASGGDGQYPDVTLLLGDDGMLYSTTYGGGTHGDANSGGTVFKIGRDGTGYEKLHDFGGTGDGQLLNPGLVKGDQGALYGATYVGGVNGSLSSGGTLFKINTNGTGYRVLFSFPATPNDGQLLNASLVRDGSGAFYGTTEQGGDTGYGSLFRWVDLGNVRLDNPATLAVTATATKFNPDQTLTFALSSPPGGMSIGFSSGAITWTPTKANVGQAYEVVWTVADSVTPSLSAMNSFWVTVPNHAPSFSLNGSRISVPLNPGAQTVLGWVKDISPGPATEDGQAVHFHVSNNNAGLFDGGGVAPAISDSGTLTFTPKTGATGAATVTVYAQDDGGTALGGQDTSPSQTFDIYVSQAHLVIHTQPSATATAGVAFAQQPVVWVVDGNEALITDDNTTVVTVARNSGSGTRDLKGPNSPITMIVSGGIATFSGLKYEGAESIRLDFSASGLATVTSDLIAVGAADPSKLVFTRQPTKEIAGIPFSVQPIIRLQDAYGNFTLPTATSLNVTMALSQGSGALSGTKVLDIGSSAGNGTVTYTDLSIDTGGANKRLTASADTLTDAVSAIFEVTQNQPPVFTGTVATVVGTIKSFGATTPSGMNPSGSLILGTDAVLYGTTEFGGDDAEGTVFAVSPDGTGFRVVHAFAEEGEVPESGGEYPRAAVLEVGGALYGTTYAGGDNSFGTVFKVNKDGTGFVILHQFGGKPAGDGGHPAAALVVGNSGALYGVTEDGGTDDLGTVFSLATDGSGYSILHSFTAAHSDGSSPQAALLKASDGALYGTTERGGTGGNGTVFKLNEDGTGYDVVYAFAGGTSGNYPAAALIEVGGVLYGTTSAGGANQVGTVFQLNPNGTGFSVLHSFSSPGGIGQNVVSGLILGLNGALYGATTYGGASDAGMIYKITTDATPVLTILHNFDISDENSARPALVQRAADGRVFGTTFFGGAEDLGTVFAMDAGGGNFQVLKEFLTTANGVGWYPDGALTEGTAGVFYGTTYDGGTAKVGTVYRINGDGTGYTVLHSLGATAQDGTNSTAPLTLSNGQLYGSTLFGGTYGGGTVFKIGTDGTGYTKLHDFGAGADGATLWGRAILGSDGFLYGLTLEGGTHGKGTVFKMDTSGGNYAVLYNFGANADDGASPYARLAQGTDGTFYGVTYAGGTANAGTIFRISPDGNGYSVLHRFGDAAGDGVHPWAGVLVNNSMLYGTTYDGGADDLGIVFRINEDGSGYANLHSFGADDAQHPYSALVLGTDDAIYGTTWLGGSSDRGGIFRIRSDGTYDLLYNFDQGKNPYCRLALGSDGLWYGTTESGGSYNLGTAFRMQVVTGAELSLAETSTLTLRVLATDPDPGENLTYSLVTAPDGMTIDAQTGVITWTPAEGTGPGSYPVTVKVTDNGVPPLSATTSFTITVNEQVMDTATTVASSLNPSLKGQSVTFTATVTKAGGDDPLTGTVTFKADGVALGAAVPLDGAGRATLVTAGLAVGTHAIAAEYSGLTGVYLASTGTVAQAVSKANTTTLVESNLNPSRGGQPVTFKATVTAVAPGAGIPGGTATFKDGEITLGSVSLDVAGSASLTTTAVGVGTWAITVEYGGDSSFESSSGNLWQTVEDPGTWAWGDSYTWRISDATGIAGTGWDWLDIPGTLDISATVASPFTIKIVSLNGSSAGDAAHFVNTQNYTWCIATASGGVTGFAADKFIIDDTAFLNAKGGGHFSITQSGKSVYLHFGHVTASPVSVGRAWGTFLRIPVAAVNAKITGGTAPYTLLSVTSRESADFVRISGDYILFAPAGNTNSILDYSVEDSANPTKALASSIINVTITNAVSSVNSISNNVENGTVTIRFAGIPGYGYAVERSSDLASWDTVWTTNAPAGGVWMFTDGPDPAPPNPSYYRLRQNN